jgi:hypothetical protein
MGLSKLFFAILLVLTLEASVCFPAVVAHYRFENGSNGSPASGSKSILDSSGNGLHGDPYLGPTYSSNVPSGQNFSTRSIRFSPPDQGIFIQDNPLFQLTSSLTLEAFINSQANPIADAGQILFRGDDRPGLDPYYLALTTSGNLLFQIENATYNAIGLQTDSPLQLNRWYHVAGTLDNSSGQMRLYVDGVLQKSTTTSIRPLATLDSQTNPGLGIGTIQSFTQRFNGFIDEVRVSNEALPPSSFLINQPVPEPSSITLFTLFGAGMCLVRTRRNR